MSGRKIFIAFCMALILGLGVGLYWFVTAHGFSAREKPWAVEAFIARNVRRLAIPSGAKELENPITPTPLNMAEARDHFADHSWR